MLGLLTATTLLSFFGFAVSQRNAMRRELGK